MAEDALRTLDAAVRRSASLLSSFDDFSPITENISHKILPIDIRGLSDSPSVPPPFPDFTDFLSALLLPLPLPTSSASSRPSRTIGVSPKIASARPSEPENAANFDRKIPTHFFRKFRDSKRAFDFRNL